MKNTWVEELAVALVDCNAELMRVCNERDALKGQILRAIRILDECANNHGGPYDPCFCGHDSARAALLEESDPENESEEG